MDTAQAFEVERYKYILQQLHTVNENVYRFLAIYQTIATVLVGAALTLFVRYEDWHIRPDIARIGIVAILLAAHRGGRFHRAAHRGRGPELAGLPA